MLDETERQHLVNLPPAEKASTTQDQIDRIHNACHAGSLDVPTIDDALARLKALHECWVPETNPSKPADAEPAARKPIGPDSLSEVPAGAIALAVAKSKKAKLHKRASHR